MTCSNAPTFTNTDTHTYGPTHTHVCMYHRAKELKKRSLTEKRKCLRKIWTTDRGSMINRNRILEV